MSPQALETYLHEQIPLTRTMQISVLSATHESLTLTAPLEPNINPHHTFFGGSAATMAILAAWSLLHTRLAPVHPTAQLVIARQTMTYHQPMPAAVIATATFPTPDDLPLFLETLTRKQKARLPVQSLLHCQGIHTATLTADFVALL